MIVLYESDHRIDSDRFKRSIARTSGDCACAMASGLVDDRAVRNLSLLYGGARGRVVPAYGSSSISPKN